MSSRRRVSAALITLLVLVAGGWYGQQALSGPPSVDRPAVVASAPVLQMRALSQLPPQATEVWQLIQQGGPFPYRQDGTVFGNREGRLPKRQSGFYREYTVPTPGESDRGARRLVTGGPVTGGPVTGGPVTGGPVTGGPVTGGPVTGGPVTGGTAELYYTGDHYVSFVVVDPQR